MNDSGKQRKYVKNSRNGGMYKQPIFLVTSAKEEVGGLREQGFESAISCLIATAGANLFILAWISVWFPPSQLPQQSAPSFYRHSVKKYFLLFVLNLLMAGVTLVLAVRETVKNLYFFHLLYSISNSMDPNRIYRSLKTLSCLYPKVHFDSKETILYSWSYFSEHFLALRLGEQNRILHSWLHDSLCSNIMTFSAIFLIHFLTITLQNLQALLQ